MQHIRAGRRFRGVWFWALSGTVVAVLVLWGGTQIARAWGQSVDWYAGFGQWLGALCSLTAAVVALWIATSERRHADQQREIDLARQASLVRVTAANVSERDITGAPLALAGIGVRNRRPDRIFEIETVRFGTDGMEIVPLRVSSIEIHPNPQGHRYTVPELPHLSVGPDEVLHLVPHEPADYAAIRYTDSSGRRWQVDTYGNVGRFT